MLDPFTTMVITFDRVIGHAEATRRPVVRCGKGSNGVEAMALAQWMLWIGLAAGGIALVVSAVQFFRGKLDLTPFLDTVFAVTLVVVLALAGKEAFSLGLVFYFGVWQALIRARVRQWELERAMEQKQTASPER